MGLFTGWPTLGLWRLYRFWWMRENGVFKRNRTPLEVKVLAAVLRRPINQASGALSLRPLMPRTLLGVAQSTILSYVPHFKS